MAMNASSARWVSALPLLGAIAVHAWVTRNPVVGTLLAGALFLGCVYSTGTRGSRVVKEAIAVGALVVGIYAGEYLPFQDDLGGPHGILSAFAPRLAMAALLAAIARRFLIGSTDRNGGTLVLALSAVVACGAIRPGPIYPIFVALFALAVILTLAVTRRAPISWLVLDRRRKAASVGAGIIAIIVSLFFTRSLPAVHDWIVGQIGGWDRRDISGFMPRIELGGAADILESDRVVLRVYGHADYLRGIVYQRYAHGEWHPLPERGHEFFTAPEVLGSSGRIQIQSVTSDAHYFVPLGARKIAATNGKVISDSAGVLRAPWGDEADSISFADGQRDTFPVKPPTDADLEVPEPIRGDLERLAKDWRGTDDSVGASLSSLEQTLQTQFAYSLHHQRATRSDPVIDFLLHHRVGHCEYFASAMALMARALGIPARVVGGYRVMEHNRLGDYDLVRAWNAHAWVEAWVPDKGWTTYDPTSASALERNRPNSTPWIGGLLDLIQSGVLVRWIRLLGVWKVAPVVLALLALALSRRALARFLRLPRTKTKQELDADPSLASLHDLMTVLAVLGYGRGNAEPIERFAARLRLIKGIDRQLPNLLDQYTRFRYGGQGDRSEIDCALRLAVEQLKGRAQRPG